MKEVVTKGPRSALIVVLILISYFIAFPALADECLECHSDSDMVGSELTISSERFYLTAHGDLGCQACHEAVTEDHPGGDGNTAAISCQDCHADSAEEYQHSPHAENATCADCHDPHNVVPFRGRNALAMNQICKVCHLELETVASHRQWLPQAALHISALPCVTCHTATPGYEIALEIEKNSSAGLVKRYTKIEYSDLSAKGITGHGKMVIDLNGDKQISLVELETFRISAEKHDYRFHVTLVPAHLSHTLMTLDSRYDCTFCHASGRKEVQTGYLTLPDPDGHQQTLAVERGAILDALYGNRDLYITGITRSASLDLLGLIIICSGFILPVGHGTLRFLTRKNRQHGKDEQ